MTPPKDNRPRGFRGGGWHYATANGVRAAFRYVITQPYRYNYIGFRTAQCGCRQILKVNPP